MASEPMQYYLIDCFNADIVYGNNIIIPYTVNGGSLGNFEYMINSEYIEGLNLLGVEREYDKKGSGKNVLMVNLDKVSDKDAERLMDIIDELELRDYCIDKTRARALATEAENDAIIRAFGKKNLKRVVSYIRNNFIKPWVFFDMGGSTYMVKDRFIKKVNDYLDEF